MVLWALSLATLIIAIATYVRALFQQYGKMRIPPSPILPITSLSALVTFFSIAYLTRKHGLKTCLGSGLAGAIAAPMIFELPFDLIVMFRTYPPTPATLYTLLFFLPLFLVEVSSIALLTLSPALRVSKYSLFSLAAMFAVFAVWALFGFSYPSEPVPFALNAASKILCFVVAITLFLPEAP
jgi:hypothetical protein